MIGINFQRNQTNITNYLCIWLTTTRNWNRAMIHGNLLKSIRSGFYWNFENNNNRRSSGSNSSRDAGLCLRINCVCSVLCVAFYLFHKFDRAREEKSNNNNNFQLFSNHTTFRWEFRLNFPLEQHLFDSTQHLTPFVRLAESFRFHIVFINSSYTTRIHSCLHHSSGRDIQ